MMAKRIELFGLLIAALLIVAGYGAAIAVWCEWV
jgi:hypothetical protein